MRRALLTLASAAVLAFAFAVPAAAANTPGVHLKLFYIAGGLSQPLYVTGSGDGSGRLFIVEKTGKVRVYKNGALLAAPLIDLSAYVSHDSEQGLLGIAFHPKFRFNHKFYVSYTDVNGNSVINEYKTSTTNPNVVQSGSGRRILTVAQPYSNHNGGDIGFGPDGYLYIGFGDGGSGGDPGNRAQNLNSLLGKMLRIDVDGTSKGKAYKIPSTNPYVGIGGLDEIWSRGLRNPWRWSFDRVTGALWIGDVGQDRYEEVDRSPNVGKGAGRAANYGWRQIEGRTCYNPSTGCSTAGKTMPLTLYSHDSGRCSITGGYVYRGQAYPDLRGLYFFGDYCSGEIWYVSANATAPLVMPSKVAC